MASLTSFLPKLAPMLGLTPAALYERQRALVRLGALPTPKGRGRGSGAEATPETVAILLIAVMATDNFSDTDDRVQAAAALPVRIRCKLTGKRNFLKAFSAILASEALAQRVTRIHLVRRTGMTAQIYFAEPGFRGTAWSELTHFGLRTDSFNLRVEAMFEGMTVEKIQKMLSEATTKT